MTEQIRLEADASLLSTDVDDFLNGNVTDRLVALGFMDDSGAATSAGKTLAAAASGAVEVRVRIDNHLGSHLTTARLAPEGALVQLVGSAAEASFVPVGLVPLVLGQVLRLRPMTSLPEVMTVSEAELLDCIASRAALPGGLTLDALWSVQYRVGDEVRGQSRFAQGDAFVSVIASGNSQWELRPASVIDAWCALHEPLGAV